MRALGLIRKEFAQLLRDPVVLFLVLFLTKSDRAVEAAVIGEALARNNPRAPKAATVAVRLGRIRKQLIPTEVKV